MAKKTLFFESLSIIREWEEIQEDEENKRRSSLIATNSTKLEFSTLIGIEKMPIMFPKWLWMMPPIAASIGFSKTDLSTLSFREPGERQTQKCFFVIDRYNFWLK